MPTIRESLRDKIKTFAAGNRPITHPPNDEVTRQEFFEALLHLLSLEPEPTSQQIADACAEVLLCDDCDEIANQVVREALERAFTYLAIAGYEPEIYLAKKGILLADNK